jgi:hypothetical protein
MTLDDTEKGEVNVCRSGTGAVLDMQRFGVSEKDQQDAVIKRLRLLSADLAKRGYAAQVLTNDAGSWGVRVGNPTAPAYSDFVYAAPDEGGVWWLWWSWQAQITLIDDIDVAADTIAAVLEPME